MSAFRLRRVLRGVAGFLLLVVVSGVTHLPAVQDACVPSGFEQHDESKHVFAPVVELRHDHCAICHWQRVHRPAFTQLSVEIPALRSCAELTYSADAFPRHNSSDRLPARAPPAIAL